MLTLLIGIQALRSPTCTIYRDGLPSSKSESFLFIYLQQRKKRRNESGANMHRQPDMRRCHEGCLHNHKTSLPTNWWEKSTILRRIIALKRKQGNLSSKVLNGPSFVPYIKSLHEIGYGGAIFYCNYKI